MLFCGCVFIDRQLLAVESDVHLIVVSRSGDAASCAELTTLATSRKARVDFVLMDLAYINGIAVQFGTKVMALIDLAKAKTLVFVQNSGMVITSYVGQQSLDEVQALYLVNTGAMHASSSCVVVCCKQYFLSLCSLNEWNALSKKKKKIFSIFFKWRLLY